MPHYYSEKQTSKLKLKLINISVKNLSFQMYSGSGVFSKKRLDKGTEVLLKNLIVEDDSKVLDLGCGIGIVGVYVKKLYPKTSLTMVDVNRRAVLLSRKNVILNAIEADVIQSDGLGKVKESFDIVLLNPPQTAGKDVCFRLIEESFQCLNDKGLLEIVARHNKGGKTLSEKMLSLFSNVEEAGKGSGYRIYISRKSS